MVFDYYSIGDAAFLEQILNGIAMITGNGDFKMVAMIGMVFGVIIIGFQAIENTSHIDWFKALIGWVLYLIIFGSTATVAINDVYNGQIRMVSNVPVGIAVLGNWTSSIGQEITQDFEQAFALTQTSNEMKLTKGGFAAGLKHLIDMRDITLTGRVDSLGLPGVSMQKTIYNYLQYCTLPGIESELIDKDKFLHADNVMQAMKFDNNVYTTSVYLPQYAPVPRGGKIMGCGDAHVQLMQAVNGSPFITEMQKFAASKMGITDPAKIMQSFSTLQVDLDSLVGFGKDARQYMLAAVVKNTLASAEEGKAISAGDIGSAIIISQAEAQTNVQNAAAGTMFMRFVHPLMTFMEGFVLAVTPIMMLLIAMGSLGIRMAGKYLLMLIWVQLWIPIMAITNLYLNMSMLHKMAAMSDVAQLSPTSLLGMVSMHQSIQNWLGTAGMLAAATPALSLMLVYGSAVAATHLAGRLSATDTIDEKVAAPDVLKNGPVVDMAAQYQHSTGAGLRGSDAASVTPNIDIGRITQAGISSAHTLSETAQHQVQQSGNEQLSFHDSSGHTMSVQESAFKQVSESHGKSLQFAHSQMLQFAHDHGITNAQKFADTATASLGTGHSIGAAVNAASRASGETSDQISKLESEAEKFDQQTGFTAQFQEQYASDIRGAEADQHATSEDKAKTNAFADSLSKSAAAQKNFSQEVRTTGSIGLKGSFNASALYANKSKDYLEAMTQTQRDHIWDYHSPEEREAVRKDAEKTSQQLIQNKVIPNTEHGRARAQAIGYTMANIRHAGTTGKAEDMRWAQTSLADAGITVGNAGGNNEPGFSTQGATENQGIASGASQPVHNADGHVVDPNSSAHLQHIPPAGYGGKTPEQIKAEVQKLQGDNSTANLKSKFGTDSEKLQTQHANVVGAKKMEAAMRSAGRYVHGERDATLVQQGLDAYRLGTNEAARIAQYTESGLASAAGITMGAAANVAKFGETLRTPREGESFFDRMHRGLVELGNDTANDGIAGAQLVTKAMHHAFYDKAKDHGLTDAQANYYASSAMHPLLANAGIKLTDSSEKELQAVNVELAGHLKGASDDERAIATRALDRALERGSAQQDGYSMAWVNQFNQNVGMK